MNKRIRKKQYSVARRRSSKHIRKMVQRRGRDDNYVVIANHRHYMQYREDITGNLNLAANAYKEVWQMIGRILQKRFEEYTVSVERAAERLGVLCRAAETNLRRSLEGRIGK